jgi:hypothetical protein
LDKLQGGDQYATIAGAAQRDIIHILFLSWDRSHNEFCLMRSLLIALIVFVAGSVAADPGPANSVRFIENKGQWPLPYKFVHERKEGKILFSSDRVVFLIQEPNAPLGAQLNKFIGSLLKFEVANVPSTATFTRYFLRMQIEQ